VFAIDVNTELRHGYPLYRWHGARGRPTHTRSSMVRDSKVVFLTSCNCASPAILASQRWLNVAIAWRTMVSGDEIQRRACGQLQTRETAIASTTGTCASVTCSGPTHHRRFWFGVASYSDRLRRRYIRASDVTCPPAFVHALPDARTKSRSPILSLRKMCLALALVGGMRPPKTRGRGCHGLEFPGPVGLAAGMDKDAASTRLGISASGMWRSAR
jgi:hypothetical protein